MALEERGILSVFKFIFIFSTEEVHRSARLGLREVHRAPRQRSEVRMLTGSCRVYVYDVPLREAPFLRVPPRILVCAEVGEGPAPLGRETFHDRLEVLFGVLLRGVLLTVREDHHEAFLSGDFERLTRFQRRADRIIEGRAASGDVRAGSQRSHVLDDLDACVEQGEGDLILALRIRTERLEVLVEAAYRRRTRGLHRAGLV